MKGLILCNGAAPSPEMLREQAGQAELILCADGALRYAKGICKVDVLVSDFDSLEQSEAQDFAGEVVQLTPIKDDTDSQTAARIAMERGCTELVFLGALGGRFDHALGNLQLLIYCAQRGCKGVLMDELCQVRVCCTSIELQGTPGDLLSIVPLGVNVEIERTEGLYYPLLDEYLPLGLPRGISNVFTKEKALIEVKNGWIAVILAKDRA